MVIHAYSNFLHLVLRPVLSVAQLSTSITLNVTCVCSRYYYKYLFLFVFNISTYLLFFMLFFKFLIATSKLIKLCMYLQDTGNTPNANLSNWTPLRRKWKIKGLFKFYMHISAYKSFKNLKSARKHSSEGY